MLVVCRVFALLGLRFARGDRSAFLQLDELERVVVYFVSRLSLLFVSLELYEVLLCTCAVLLYT